MDRLRVLLERRRLVVKLVAGFTILFLTVLLMGINSIVATRDMSRQAVELYRMELLGISHLKDANIDLISTDRALRQMVLAPTFVDRDEARTQLKQAMLDLGGEIAAVRKSIFRGQERVLLNEFEQEFENYKRNVNDAITLIDRKNDYQVKATNYVSSERFNQVVDSADQLLHRMVAIKEEGARETAAAMARLSRDTERLILALLLGGLLFGTMVAVWVGCSIRQSAELLRGYRNELGAEEQFMATKARRVELVPAEAFGVVEKMPNGRLLVDEQEAIASPGHTAKIRDEECTREHLEPVDGPHIAAIRRASILVVEDNESNEEVTAGLLANASCNVTIAYSGKEALEMLEKTPHDLVLMNTQIMMDGIDATLEIRKNHAFDRLPIIALTAKGIHQDRERCVAAGMNGHIAKPIDPDRLFSAVMCWITIDSQYAGNRASSRQRVATRLGDSIH
jgi:CheY-like chemotaxis protein